MNIEFILLPVCQVLGVFPINVKGRTYTISRLHLGSSFLVLLYLISVIVLFLIHLQGNHNKQPSCGVLLQFKYFIIFTKISASIVAVVSNIVYRYKNVNFYNKLMTLTSRHQYTGQSTFKTSFTFNFVVIISIGLLCLQGILTISSFVILNEGNLNLYTLCILFIEYPVFFDTVVFCGLCTVLSNCHQQVKRQMENIYIMYCAESPESSGQRNSIKIISNLIPGSTVRQKKIITDTSKLVMKLEQLRHTNFQLFEMHLYCLSSRQFQLLLSLIIILFEIITTVYVFLSTFKENLDVDGFCYGKMIVAILAKLMRLFILCHYNGKVFQEGQNTKYILEKIRALSSESQFVILTNTFVSQIKRKKQYKICGLNTLDMSFPIKILEYTINYVLVLVQFFGFQE